MELRLLYFLIIFCVVDICLGTKYLSGGQDRYRYRNATRGNNYPDYGRRCGFPIIMPSYAVTPNRQLGKHYSYLTLQEEEAVVNSIIHYIGRANRILVPSGFVEAQSQRSTQFYYNTPTGDCQYEFTYGWQADDGRYVGFSASSDQPNYQGMNSAIYLFDDYRNVEIIHYCPTTAQNLRTGYCEHPYIYVNTRVRPDEMSSGLRRYVDQTVDRVLSKYCLSRNDLYEYVWITERPTCTVPEPTCFTQAADGWDIATGYYAAPS